jgi:hypothetical protein
MAVKGFIQRNDHVMLLDGATKCIDQFIVYDPVEIRELLIKIVGKNKI